MKTKHKHYAAIVAFANGYEIEMLGKQCNYWHVAKRNPGFHESDEYRVVQNSPKYKVLYSNYVGNLAVSSDYHSSLEEFKDSTHIVTGIQLLESQVEPEPKRTPHKNKEFMIAFAEGEPVEEYMNFLDYWIPVVVFGRFHKLDATFRIKPKVPKFKVLYKQYYGRVEDNKFEYVVSKAHYENREDFTNLIDDDHKIEFIQMLEHLPEPLV